MTQAGSRPSEIVDELRNTTPYRTSLATALRLDSIDNSVSVRASLLHLQGLVKCKKPIRLILPGCRIVDYLGSSKAMGVMSVALTWENDMTSLTICGLSGHSD